MMKTLPDIPINWFLKFLDDNGYEILKPVPNKSGVYYGTTNEALDDVMMAIMGNRVPMGEVSDGFHTFNELYEHRIMLFLALARITDSGDYIAEPYRIVWRSKKHSDGSEWPGWFILGIGFHGGRQITYHLPDSKWELTDFAQTRDKAPDYDGHTSADVLERLQKFYL